MIFLLDTNAAIAAMRGDADIRRFLRLHSVADFSLSAIVAHELYYGAHHSARRDTNIARVQAFNLEIVPFDAQDAARSGEIRALLAARGTPIGPLDILIAGQALARNLTLLTRDTAEFARIPKLRITDWRLPAGA